MQPHELKKELNNLKKGQAKRLRHSTTREITAPPEMWHLDSNLLNINLEEFEDGEELKD